MNQILIIFVYICFSFFIVCPHSTYAETLNCDITINHVNQNSYYSNLTDLKNRYSGLSSKVKNNICITKYMINKSPMRYWTFSSTGKMSYFQTGKKGSYQIYPPIPSASQKRTQSQNNQFQFLGFKDINIAVDPEGRATSPNQSCTIENNIIKTCKNKLLIDFGSLNINDIISCGKLTVGGKAELAAHEKVKTQKIKIKDSVGQECSVNLGDIYKESFPGGQTQCLDPTAKNEYPMLFEILPEKILYEYLSKTRKVTEKTLDDKGKITGTKEVEKQPLCPNLKLPPAVGFELAEFKEEGQEVVSKKPWENEGSASPAKAASLAPAAAPVAPTKLKAQPPPPALAPASPPSRQIANKAQSPDLNSQYVKNRKAFCDKYVRENEAKMHALKTKSKAGVSLNSQTSAGESLEWIKEYNKCNRLLESLKPQSGAATESAE